jgi:hypothetical protein
VQTDGWTSTHDLLVIPYRDRRAFLDLGAERATIGAERGNERITVESSSFVADSPVRDLLEAVGQFVVYRALLAQAEPERSLFTRCGRERFRVGAVGAAGAVGSRRGSFPGPGLRPPEGGGSPMDHLDCYRRIVIRRIEEDASNKPAYGDIRTEAVVDRERDHYEVIQVGW